MSHPNTNHDLRRRPRKRRQPSQRNLAIHQAYRCGLRSQVQLAEEFGITQCRVSRIVANVDQWLASDASRGGPDADEQARLEWRLEKLRTSAIMEAALRCHDQMPREVCSSRSRVGRSGEMREEIRREIAPDVQWLKIAVRAAERLQRLMASPPPCEEGEHSISASEGRTNWHEWHTPLGAEPGATDRIEAAPQATALPEVGA